MEKIKHPRRSNINFDSNTPDDLIILNNFHISSSHSSKHLPVDLLDNEY